MFVFARAITYATLFISLMLVFLPRQVLEWSGAVRPDTTSPIDIAGIALAVIGGAIAVACVLAFATLGKGTPMPLDPPRRLVVRGPYRFLRNPMYAGAGLALAGAALYYRSVALLAYLVALAVVTQLLVVFYEEPTLSRLFGSEYADYRSHVHRWLPRI